MTEKTGGAPGNRQPQPAKVGQHIGIENYDDLIALLEQTFERLYGRKSDPQDMIQYMEANILHLRRLEDKNDPS
jgi:hypothetical protein